MVSTLEAYSEKIKMNDRREAEKAMKKIKTIIGGGHMTKASNYLLDKALLKCAESPYVSYETKRNIAQKIFDNEQEIRNRCPEDLRSLVILGRPSSVPVHMHYKEWDEVRYNIWEEKSLSDGKSSYTVFFPGLKFPIFERHTKGKDYDSEGFDLDQIVGNSIWKGVLFQSSFYRETESNKRPCLKTLKEISREGVPVKVSKENVCIPVFDTESIKDANVEARAVIKVYREYKSQVENLIGLLKTNPKVRKEFLEAANYETKISTLLEENGLKLDLLPKVISRESGEYEGVTLVILEMDGGSSAGANWRIHKGFIPGIVFPDFNKEFSLPAHERGHFNDTLQLIFEYLLYTNNFFKPEEGMSSFWTPQLLSRDHEEATISRMDKEIPEGFTIPYLRVLSKDPSQRKKTMEETIRTYNQNRDVLLSAVEMLKDRNIQRGIIKILGGHYVNQHSDSVAEFLGEKGAKFMIENPTHIERKERMNEQLFSI